MKIRRKIECIKHYDWEPSGKEANDGRIILKCIFIGCVGCELNCLRIGCSGGFM
jgi:hypothetical protein